MRKKHYHVAPRDGAWEVKAAGAQRASSIHRTQAEAIASARPLAERAGGELIVHRADGRIRDALVSRGDPAPYTASKSSAAAASAEEKKPPLAVRIGERLRRARIMTGHSLRSLADELNSEVSHTQLQKIEAGDVMPDSKLLARLGQALDVRPDYFFKSDELKLVTVEYRSQTSKLGAKPRQRLEEQAYEFFERYLEIERIVGLRVEPLPQADLSEVEVAELPDAIENAAEALRKKWQLGMNPIPNVHVMLESHGVKVRILPHEEGFDGFSAFAEGGGLRVPVMALSARWLRSDEKDLPRFRFTAIHELAHLHVKWPKNLGQKETENCCHHFAGAFLIPRKPFEERFGANRVQIALKELCAIKAEWGVSVAAIMKRANNLGLVTAGRYKTYCIVAAKNGWRTKDPGKWIGEEESSRFEPLVLRALAQELISTSKAAGLLGISLPELGEKFETID
jgi:Zn-dependent peptidase ImmA (M78 family)/ribosome-binding protein aMBF1 (putative translation factor)